MSEKKGFNLFLFFVIIYVSLSVFALLFTVYLLGSLCHNYWKSKIKLNKSQTVNTKCVLLLSVLAIIFYIFALSTSLAYDSDIIQRKKDETELDDAAVILLFVELVFWTLGHICFYILSVKRYQILYTVKKIQKDKYKDCYTWIVCMIALYGMIGLGITGIIFGMSYKELEHNKSTSQDVAIVYFVIMF